MLEFDTAPREASGLAKALWAATGGASVLPPAPEVLDPVCVHALSAVSAPLMVHDGERIVFANAALQRLLGYSLAELCLVPHYAWASEASIEPVKAYGERCLQTQDDLPTLECEALTANGSVRHLEISASRIAGPQGPLALLTCTDLSDMRHVQDSLLNVGRVMYQILENNPVATFVIDTEHRITHWNAACVQLTGLSASEMVGSDQTWRPFFSEPRPLMVDLIVDGKVIDESELQRLAGANLRASPSLPGAYETEDYFPQFGQNGRWVFCTAAPLYDTQGRLIGAIETLMDVSRRHAAEEELKRHQQELETLVAERSAELLRSHQDLDAFLENASVGILCTSKRQILRSNKKFAQMFEMEGLSNAEMAAFNYFPDAAAYKAMRNMARPTLQAGQSVMHEMELRTASNQLIWVQLIAYPANPGDPDTAVWWLLQDRSEVMRAQRELVNNYRQIQQANARLEDAQNQLLQSEKMASIGQLAAGVAHEINNPVGFVASNLGTLRRYIESMLQLNGLYETINHATLPDELRKQIECLRQEADFEFIQEDLPQLLRESDDGLGRVKKIVQDLKDFSRVDQADWQDADLNQGLESTLNVVRHEIKYKVEVRRDYGPLPPVRCLAAQLNQVFMNLIVNAAHAMPGQGLLQLRTEAQGDWVCISVRDNGQGMPPEVMRRIFDPFFTTKPVGQGTGLGLSLSFSIVKKHGGRIEVESEPGVGSCFKVWIPVQGPGTDTTTA
ncbi:ATP-binding protein [Paucibacter sp. B51]|uniref:ATP-binding protein n=1 Tax=Paucibacter sp. B51 TaxID=2993315 RepID=UPI0022EBBDFA|nr:ATP-binding protein [Paucibacter sp. B51]